MYKISRGVTLIELVVVLAVIGILSTLAIPSYRSYMIRVYRSEVQALMLTIVNREEEYFLDARQYGKLSDLHLAVSQSIGDHYTVTVEPDNTALPPGYTIKAIPQPILEAQGEPILQLDSLGNSNPPELWRGQRE